MPARPLLLASLLLLALSNAPARALVVASELDTFGYLRDVLIDGDVAYALAETNGELLVADVSDRLHPETLFSTIDVAGSELARLGHFLYVGGGFAERLFDVSDPRTPVEIGSFPGLGGSATFDGTRAYAFGPGEIRSFDVSDPTSPVDLGHSPVSASALAARDGLVYALDGSVSQQIGDDLEVLDLSDPTAPVVIGRWTRIWLDGSRAYLTDPYGALHVIDVGDPAHPVELAKIDALTEVESMEFRGGATYVARRSGIELWDLADPAHPEHFGGLELPGRVHDVAVQGDYAYVANDAAGFRIVDLALPWLPRVRGGLDLAAPYDVAAAPPHAFVVDGATLRVIDAADPDHPAEVAHADAAAPAPVAAPSFTRVALTGNVAVAGGSHLEAFDVSDPLAAASLGSLAEPGEDLAVAADRAYLVGGDSIRPPRQLHAIDLSDPHAPFVVDSLDTATAGLAVAQAILAVEGDRAYVGVSETGGFNQIYGAIDAFGTSDSLHRRGTAPIYPAPTALAMRSPFAFVTSSWIDAFYWLRIHRFGAIEAGDASHPVGQTAVFGGAPSEIALVGGVAYVATAATLWAVDVHDVRHPRVLGGVEVGADRIAPMGRFLLATALPTTSSASGALHVVEFGAQYERAPEPSAAVVGVCALLAAASIRRSRG